MSATGNYVVRRIEARDVSALEDFYHRNFPDRPRLNDMAVWRWEFTRHPRVVGAPPFFIIDADGEIQGAIGYIPLDIRLRGRSVSAGHPVNYFVHPSYKGLPALQLLMAVLGECHNVVAGYFSPDARRLFEKLGFVDLSSHVRSYYLPLPGGASARPGETTVRARLLRALRIAWNGFVRSAVRALGRREYKIERRLDDRFAIFIDDASDPAYGVRKDLSYMRWRYEESPVLNCVFIHQWSQGTPSGLAVVHLDSRRQEAALVDLIARPGNLFNTLGLVTAAVDYAASQRLALVTTQLLSRPWDRALRWAGFGRTAGNIGLIVRAPDPETLEEMKDPARWHYVIGDTDVY